MSSLTEYAWTAEQSGNGKFAAAKRKVSKQVKSQIPYGWSYKIMASGYKVTTWEIKFDYSDWNKNIWVTLRWRPCRVERADVDKFSVYINYGSTSKNSEAPINEIQKVLADIPRLKNVVSQILGGMHPDPLMQLHAKAKQSEAVPLESPL